MFQNESVAARRRIYFRVVDAAGNDVTGQAYDAAEIQVSKAGASPANSAGSDAEVGGGLYYYEPTQGEADTLGELSIKVAAKGTGLAAAGVTEVVPAPVAEVFTKTATTIDTTERSMPNDSTTLTPRTERGVFQAFLALNDMASGDTLTFRVYETIGGTQRVVYEKVFNDAQSPAGWVSPAFALVAGWDMTLARTGGTTIDVAWRIVRAGAPT